MMPNYEDSNGLPAVTQSRLEFPFGKITVIGDGSQIISPQFVERLITYSRTLTIKDKKPTEGDCAAVAGEAVKRLQRYFETKGYHLTTVSTESQGRPIPRYKQLGYGHHVINMAIGEHDCIAIDLTAPYTYDNQADLIVVTGSSEEEVLSSLRKFSGTRWEVAG